MAAPSAIMRQKFQINFNRCNNDCRENIAKLAEADRKKIIILFGRDSMNTPKYTTLNKNKLTGSDNSAPVST